MRMGYGPIIECMLSVLQALGACPSTEKQERGHQQVIQKVSPAGNREWQESWDLTWGRGQAGPFTRDSEGS